MRRTLIISSIAVATVIIIGGILYLIFGRGPSVSVAPATGGSTLPIAGQSSGTQPVATFSPTPVQKVTERLVQIASGPIVPGEAITDFTTSSTSAPHAVVSYIDRQSGNVFSYDTQTGTITRTSNQTIPGIESAVWLSDASMAAVRFLTGTDFSTVNTYMLPANSASSTQKGFFLQQGIADVSVSSTSVLTLASGVNGSVASIEDVVSAATKQAFTSPISQMRASFLGNTQYLAFTKPSATLPGYAFLVSSSGSFSTISGPLNGLVALASHSGAWVLISYTDTHSAFHMELIQVATGTIVPLPVATIADKCVWTNDDSAIYCGIPQNPPSGYSFPDDWYQGAVSFSDRIWKIDVAGRFAQLVLDFPKETKNATLDAEALAVDPLATELVFVNKADGSLWGYGL